MRIFRSGELPWWVVEVCAALDKPTVRLEHGAELGLVAAVNDALAWARDTRPYEVQHERPWQSVIDDFGATVRRVGAESQLGKTIAAELALAVNDLKVPEAHKPDDRRRRAEAALDALSSQLLHVEVVTAGWSDLILACQDASVDAAELAWRRSLFLELAAHAGRAVPSLVSTLTGILDDRLVDVTSARARLGEVKAPSSGDWPSLDDDAGLSESERLDLCERLTAVDPVPTRCIVCVGFDHARLADRTTVTEGMVFYPAAQAKKLVEVKDPLDSGPVALIPLEAAHWLPDGDDEVVAVVDLGIVNPARAVSIGASNCEAVVALINARLREPAWRPMTGHILVANGWFTKSFARSDRSLPPHWADPMGSRLQSLGERVGSHLPVTAPLLQSVVEASHRLLAAQNEAVDAAGRLLLTVRVIEDAAGWASGPPKKWHRFAGSFEAAWAEETLRADLFAAVSDAVDEFSGSHLDEKQERAELQRLRSQISADQPDGTFVINLQAACENLPALAAMFPVGCGPGRELATLDRHLVDGPAVARLLSRRSDDYRRLLARAVRCRNAAAHGGPLPGETVESVLDWAKVVATSLRNACMDALLTDDGDDPSARIADAYSRIGERTSKRRTALRRGAGVVETLFVPREV